MALGAQLPIRFDPDVERRLEAIASRLGTSKSALIRLLAKSFVDKYVDDRDQVHLPPDWEEIMKAALPRIDARSRISSSTTPADRTRFTSPADDPAAHYQLNESFNSNEASAAAQAANKVSDANLPPAPSAPKSPRSPRAAAPSAGKARPSRAGAKPSKDKPDSPGPAPA